MNDPWGELVSIPASMADAVRPLLARATREDYGRYLDAMFHYTRSSGARLRHAAERTTDPQLRGFFAELAREEAAHYRLAEADLAALGGAPGSRCPAEVQRFHDRWMTAEDPCEWIGSLVALEGVGAHLASDAATHLARLALAREQVRFVSVHLDVDVEHSAGALDHARRLGAPPALVTAAHDAARFWVQLHIDALSGGHGTG